MGKTIQAIALMLANRPSKAHAAVWSKQEESHGHIPNPSMRAGTLVVCPLVALLQWQSEIGRFTQDGCLSVLVYHGSSREDVKAVLQKADVVLTTYSIVESEFRKMMSPEKVCIVGLLFGARKGNIMCLSCWAPAKKPDFN